MASILVVGSTWGNPADLCFLNLRRNIHALQSLFLLCFFAASAKLRISIERIKFFVSYANNFEKKLENID